ncbi:MAG: hypothetical protein KGQ58_07285 [Proteobacteria bacterium]|nr:hypothetical protein [Pseudomonadota bacterium]MDE3207632.1 hypothetical protein [Pseudomonadota bacterium]
MGFWQIFSDLSWAISGLMAAWMIYDTWHVQQQYDESFLMSSREGAEELTQKEAGK